MGINLQSAANYIHGSSAQQLDGLFAVVDAKCKELGITPGKRDNMASNGESGNVNVRGFLQFVESVQPLPEAVVEDPELAAANVSQPGDDHATLLKKAEYRNAVAEKKAATESARKTVQADHDALRKLYGTLQAKFASCGYTPK